MEAIDEADVAAVRSFTRFYTRKIGALREGMLESPFSLTEVRVLYELAHRKTTTAAELSRDLSIDRGYLSRILRRFTHRGLVSRRRSSADGRESPLALTPRGAEAFAPLLQQQVREVRAMLGELPAGDRRRVVRAMQNIEQTFAQNGAAEPFILRPHRPGDMGWVVAQHGATYAREFGWDISFEALVAEATARFLNNFDPKMEHCWIAERAGENVGSVFVVNDGNGIARLRMLIVDPAARGFGLGRRLVDECVRFARERDYTKMVLWTYPILKSAVRIYESVGFRVIEQEPEHRFGHDLVSQTWELNLVSSRA